MPAEPIVPESPADLSKHEQGGTLLIVEDEESLRSLMTLKFKSAGYQVLEAANGEAAMELAGRHSGRIDFLLTDVIMPKLRGPEFAALLRARYPDIKVVFMSGYTESALVRDGMLEPNTVLLKKPFSLKKLLEATQQLSVSVRS